MPCFLSQRNLARSVQNGVRWLHTHDSQGTPLVQSIFLVFFLRNNRIILYLSGFARSGMYNFFAWPTRHRTPTSRRNQSWSNQLLLIILGSCDQGFDLKRVVVQALRGQTVETRIQLIIVIIFLAFLGVNWTATCSAARVARSVQLDSIQTSISEDSEMKILTKSECCFPSDNQSPGK